MLIDAQAVQRAEHVAAEKRAEVRGLREGQQILGRLAEVLIDPLGRQLVVALHRGRKPRRVNAQLLRQLLDGIGLLHDAGLHGRADHHIAGRERQPLARRHAGRIHRIGHIDARAADGVEGDDLVLIVAVPDAGELVLGLQRGHVQRVVVGSRLAADPRAVEVHLEEGLVADPAGHALVGIPQLGIRRHGGASEGHERGNLVFHAAGPNAGLDALALASRLGHGHAADGRGVRIQLSQKIGVSLIAARGQDDALASVKEHASVADLRIGAGHLAVFVLGQLHKRRLIAQISAPFLGLLQHVVAHLGQNALGSRRVTRFGHRRIGLGLLFFGIGVVEAVIGGIHRPHAVGTLVHVVFEIGRRAELGDGVADPVECGAGFGGPYTGDAGIAPAVGVTGVLVQHLERIDLNRVDARANDADVTLDAAVTGTLFDGNDVHALLSCRGRGRDTAGPKAAHEHFTIDSIDHVESRRIGGTAVPGLARRRERLISGACLLRRRRRASRERAGEGGRTGSHHATLQKAAAIQVSHRFPPTFETRGAWGREYVPQRPSASRPGEKDRGNVHPHPALCLSANGIKEEKPLVDFVLLRALG